MEKGNTSTEETEVQQTPPELDDATLKAELDGMISEALGRNAGGEESAEPDSTNEPEAPAEEEPKRLSLDDIIVPDDANVSGFFKGKPITEVFKSHHNAETRLRELGQEVNQLKTKLAAQEAVKEVLEKRKQSQEPQKPKSLLDGIDLKKDPLVNPEGFFNTLTQRVEQRAAQIAEEKIGKYKAETMLDKGREEKFKRGMTAIEGARRKLIMQGHDHLKDDANFDRVAKAMITDINTNKQFYGPDGLQREESFLRAFSNLSSAIGGKRPPSNPNAQAAKPTPPAAQVPRASNPPGSSRPASTGRTSPTKVPTLKHEQAELANQIAARILDGGLGEIPQKERDEIMEEIRQTTAKKLYAR